MPTRRDFFKAMAAAPAVLLIKPLSAQQPAVPVSVPAPVPVSRAQNLSEEELRQAFLNKWIPRVPEDVCTGRGRTVRTFY